MNKSLVNSALSGKQSLVIDRQFIPLLTYKDFLIFHIKEQEEIVKKLKEQLRLEIQKETERVQL